jgi:hypothetical protein
MHRFYVKTHAEVKTINPVFCGEDKEHRAIQTYRLLVRCLSEPAFFKAQMRINIIILVNI